MRRARKKSDITPNSIITNALRKLWLRSRERQAALKRDSYTCADCGRKQSAAKGKEFKVQVDHLDGSIDWTALIAAVRLHLLVPHDRLETVCKDDHEARTAARTANQNFP